MNKMRLTAYAIFGTFLGCTDNEFTYFRAPNGHIEIETPVNLVRTDLPLPEEAKEKMESLLFYSGSKDEHFVILLNEVKYKPHINIPLDAAARGGIRQLKQNRDVSDFSYTRDSMLVSGYHAILLKGSYNSQHTIQRGFLAEVIKDGAHTFSVMVVYDRTRSDQKDAAEKVIRSIKVKTN